MVIENMPSVLPTEILAGIVPGHSLLENNWKMIESSLTQHQSILGI